MADSSWWVDASELDDEQSDVISLPPDGNFLVVGPPGSGKTNLLLLRASYLVSNQRPNVLILTFTRRLREFITRGTENYAVADEKIQTFIRWEHALLREHGVRIDDKKPFSELRTELARRLADVFDRKPALERHLDCILVDEVQDCLPQEVELFFRSAKNVFFVGDHRQQIYAANGIIDLLDGRVVRKELTRHYRNGEWICKVADVIGKNFGEPPLIGSCNYDETKAKSGVAFEACKDEEEIFQKLATRLVQQLKAYPDELLGVACPKNEDVAKVRRALAASKQVAQHLLDDDVMVNPFDDGQRICVCTMHDAKGLEFRALHLPFIEHVSRMRETQKKLVFTSVTRAKTSLTIYHVAPLPGYIEQAREKISPPPKTPTKVSDLFMRNKMLRNKK
ncbi:UvrD-helicase domain-containing protein [Sorangium sp. So ce1024]|uniref:UvrD-helicase domain-containing protein n=1 Tax=Sorangium sp. So ce1024 TaxID=3133327 RepID=UPI003F095551